MNVSNVVSTTIAPMPLCNLLDGIDVEQELPSAQVGDLRLDSRKINEGDVFVAINGSSDHGERYIDKAFSAGAAIALVDRCSLVKASENQTIIAVESLTEKLPQLAANRYLFLCKNLHIVGVTGTNGKSSCVSYIAQLYKMLGYSSASVGTLGYQKFGEQAIETGLTTPDIFDLYRQLSLWQSEGVSHVAMEVSSHGLDQNRVQGVPVTTAVFTCLSRDHLDYHGDMDSYAHAKAKLFSFPSLKHTVINVDDSFGQKLHTGLRANVSKVSFSLRSVDSQFCASDIKYLADGAQFLLSTPDGDVSVKTDLYGEFNIYNLLAAIAVVYKDFDSLGQLAKALGKVQPVVGRMQIVDVNLPVDINVIIDYAHTPDALARALESVREHCHGRVIVVFGCGGDRDVGKRAMMAQVAEQYADYSVVTDDNPRTEDPKKIIADICSGYKNTKLFVVEHDRGLAIKKAVDMAEKNDLVLLAGKGHENYQYVEGLYIPFSDYDQALSALTQKAGVSQ